MSGESPQVKVICVVEDEMVVLDLTEAMLARAGCIALTASSGRQAIELLRQPDLRVDLALIDVVLHDMTGLELAKEIVGMRPGLPIIFMSRQAEDDPGILPEFARRAPVLIKPFASSALIHRIQEILDKPNAASAEHGA